jgi:hypothetical protein
VPVELIFVIVVIVAAVAGVAWWAGQRRRTERLQDRFGPEYERTVGTTQDRAKAESELEARQQRVDSLDIRPLPAEAKARFSERWRIVQALFVDDPGNAVDEADGLIGEVMRARGYPVGDFEQRAADVSVDHPHVVDHYRTAHAIADRQRATQADTEQLRQAMVHYRALFADLLETPDTAAPETAPRAEASTIPTEPATDAPAEASRPSDAETANEPARRSR